MPNDTRYGPDTPHPLSTRKTELIWEGKYDEYGNRRAVDIAGCAMPLQKIETVDEPRARAEGQGQLFEPEKAHRDDFRNMLIWGDNKLVMASLLKTLRGKIDLIYIDPPFDVGQDFTMDVPFGDGKETIGKDQSTLELVAYHDMWGRGTDSYLHMMYERLALMKELLSATGTLYIHVDWRVSPHLRGILDDLFGSDNFMCQIIWKRSSIRKAQSKKWLSVDDVILVATKSSNYVFNTVYLPYSEEYKRRFNQKDEHGYYYWIDIGTYSQERLEKLKAEGRVRFPDDPNAHPRIKHYLHEGKGVQPDNVWTDIIPINSQAREDTGYDTQKPEALLERIIEASSNEGDIVADLFCGSGTTGAVAERLGRRWIMCDLGRFAIHTSRKRLIEIQRRHYEERKPYRSFDVYNLGRYERQWWQKAQLNGADGEHRRVVLEFYRAEPLESPLSPLLHGRKGQTLVHVDAIDGILTRDEVSAVATSAKEAGAREVACLAWEFEIDLRLTCNRLEQELGVKIKLVQIPREIMERNRKGVNPKVS